MTASGDKAFILEKLRSFSGTDSLYKNLMFF